MSRTEIILLILCMLFFVVAVVCAVLYARRKRDLAKLTESVERYVEDGSLTYFSTKDNAFAPLQNAVSDLENRLELEKRRTKMESEKNSAFIADISHQLKTPLAGLRLYCEMEHNAAPTEHTAKELQLIEKMEKMIYQLIRLEKLKSDSYPMEFRLYETRDIADEVVRDFAALFPEKHYSVTGSAKLRCDSLWIGEALGNLVKNASEHTAADGSVAVLIENGEGSTQITVADNGGGVPEEELPFLFTRFYKTENAVPNSAGIGLAITKAIAERHHGTITAENKGGGLSVVMCFPHIDGSELL